MKPSNAVGIVETDLNVDFDAPVGYNESAHAAAAAGGDSSGATGAIGGGGVSLPAPASGTSYISC